MIQFLKSYELTIGSRVHKVVVGQKVNVAPELADELIKNKIARRSTWKGKVEKMKTDFFKPKE